MPLNARLTGVLFRIVGVAGEVVSLEPDFLLEKEFIGEDAFLLLNQKAFFVPESGVVALSPLIADCGVDLSCLGVLLGVFFLLMGACPAPLEASKALLGVSWELAWGSWV